MKKYYLIVLLNVAALFGAALDELPIEVKAVLDSHADELFEILQVWNTRGYARKGSNVCRPAWLAGYLVKYGIERIANAEKIRRVAREHGLSVSAPKKYPYHVPGMPDLMSSENYLVIAQEVLGKTGREVCLTLKQAEHLCAIALFAEHYDLHPANYFSKPSGELVIIDTDEVAMPSQEKIKKLTSDWLRHGTRVYGRSICMNPKIINDPLISIDLARFSKYPHYDEQAAAYIRKQVEQRKQLRIELLKRAHEAV